MVLGESARLRQIAGEQGLGRSGTVRAVFGVQLASAPFFRPTPHYLQRAHIETRSGVRVVIPHVRDILIAKLHRSRVEGQEGLVAKDRRAFQRVRALCDGHPNEHDVLADLIQCEPFFRPPLDGHLNSFRYNVEDLFSGVYGRRVDVAGEILAPAAELERGLRSTPTGVVAASLDELRPTRE